MQNFVNFFIARAQKGVSALEYAILIGVVVVAVAVAVGTLADNIVSEVDEVATDVTSIIPDETTQSGGGGGGGGGG